MTRLFGIRSKGLYHREKPVRDPAYRAWIRTFPSVISKSRRRIEAAHTGPHGFGQKASDLNCVALTKDEHSELHRLGPQRFQALHCVDFAELTVQYQALWEERKKAA
jgi:hypothetical protein